MSTIREEWNESQQLDGFGTPTTWRISQQIRAQKAEHEAFHAILDLIPNSLREEAIKLWVKGTDAASDEAYNRRLMMSELSDSDYEEARGIVFEAKKKLLGIRD